MTILKHPDHISLPVTAPVDKKKRSKFNAQSKYKHHSRRQAGSALSDHERPKDDVLAMLQEGGEKQIKKKYTVIDLEFNEPSQN